MKIGHVLIAAASLSAIAGTPVYAQSAHDRDVALIPNVPAETIIATFIESCEMIGRVREQTAEYVICDATRYPSRSLNIVKMYFEPRENGWSIKTNSQVNFGGTTAWSRTPDNFSMDMTLARHILDNQG